MSLYSDDHEWRHVLDNGFGDRWERSDGALLCLHSRHADFTTFRTTALETAASNYLPPEIMSDWASYDHLKKVIVGLPDTLPMLTLVLCARARGSQGRPASPSDRSDCVTHVLAMS